MLTKLFPLLFPLSYFGCLALERLLPGRPQPKVKHWASKGILLFLASGVINTFVPRAVFGALGGRSLLHLRALGVAGGVPVAFLASTLFAYLVHRASHRSLVLWRWFHQMHHSAERVDIPGFAYSHPFDLALGAAAGALAVGLLGVAPLAAAGAAYAVFLTGLLTHLDVRTPRWLGYIVQRPESHSVHHQRGVHAYNYGLPLWDMVFGTFRNPERFSAEAGFWDGASTRVWQMLGGRDVTQPLT
jgi:sterol desaturase/sphingolipid hydroxylase (fatty acid hydroxylase superfamily)